MNSVPRSVALPGGYKITVKKLSDSKANDEIGSETFAAWDVEEHTIFLRKSRTGHDLLEDFVHEMQHAFVDWADCFLGKSETQE